MIKKCVLILFLVSLVILHADAGEIDEQFQFSTSYERQQWNILSGRADDLDTLQEMSEWCEDVRDIFISAGKSRQLVQYLGEQASLCEDTELQAYLYFIISDVHWTTADKTVALLYMHLVPESAYEILYNYQPVGYYISKRTISSKANAATKIRMYTLLLNRYSDMIDIPYTLNELAQIYKKELDIKKTIKTYSEIIRTAHLYPNISDSVNLSVIKSELAFYKSNKSWIYKDLEVLINKIKHSIMKQDMKLLKSYVSRVGFIACLYNKVHRKNWTFNELQIYRRWNRRIIFSEKLEDYSNENEAFLKTTNWSFPKMKTWYFYFKRVEYPFDDRYDGGWEWKGIYFGERF